MGAGEKRKEASKQRGCLTLTKGKITWHQLEWVPNHKEYKFQQFLESFLVFLPAICLAGEDFQQSSSPTPHLSALVVPIRACRKPFNSIIYLIPNLCQALGSRKGGKRSTTMINDTVPESQKLSVLEKKNVYPVNSSTWLYYREERTFIGGSGRGEVFEGCLKG